jgi:hypothetical protein
VHRVETSPALKLIPAAESRLRQGGRGTTAICSGGVISTEQRQNRFGNGAAGSITPFRRLASRPIAEPHCEESAPMQEEWQNHLSTLRQLVCELLIKNQELRLALESAIAQEKDIHHAESN